MASTDEKYQFVHCSAYFEEKGNLCILLLTLLLAILQCILP